jgi:hypothetical protein
MYEVMRDRDEGRPQWGTIEQDFAAAWRAQLAKLRPRMIGLLRRAGAFAAADRLNGTTDATTADARTHRK